MHRGCFKSILKKLFSKRTLGNMFKKISLITMCIVMSSQVHAFKCYITLMKSSCWDKHNVVINVKDNLSGKKVVKELKFNAGDPLWLRTTFKCHAKQGLIFSAQFTPVIWENDKGKTYYTKRIWFLPKTVQKGVQFWNIPVCYPTNFAEVPTLPSSSEVCTCDDVKSKIPPP